MFGDLTKNIFAFQVSNDNVLLRNYFIFPFLLFILFLTGSPYSHILQQCNVCPVLLGGNAVDYHEGKSVSAESYSYSEIFKACHINEVSSCLKISWVMQVTMRTSSTETLSVAGNIFVGQVIFSHFHMLST